MTTRKACDAAKSGFYFNTRSWEMDLHRNDGGPLLGDDGDRFVRVPAPALLLLGPAMGFLFVIFLPFIGFALVFRELGYKAAGLIGRKSRIEATAKAQNR